MCRRTAVVSAMALAAELSERWVLAWPWEQAQAISSAWVTRLALMD